MLKLQNRHIWQTHNSDVTVISVLLHKMGKRQGNGTIILCANQKRDLSRKEIRSDIHSSRTGHRGKLIKYSFVLQTKMSRVKVTLKSVFFFWECWILHAVCPMSAEHAEVKMNATDDGFKLTLCPKWGEGEKNKNVAHQMSTYAHV